MSAPWDAPIDWAEAGVAWDGTGYGVVQTPVTGTPVPLTVDQILAGESPSRSETMRWVVTDVDGNVLGDLAVEQHSAPRISNDTGRGGSFRTLEGLVVLNRPAWENTDDFVFADEIDPFTQRVRPYWQVAGVDIPMGVFLFADESRAGGNTDGAQFLFPTLVDQGMILDQAIDRTYSRDAGNVIAALIAELLSGLGITDVEIEPSSVLNAAPLTFATGRDSWLNILQSLHALAGFLPPYFDNEGTYVARSAPDLETTDPDFLYGSLGENGTVVLDSVVYSNDMLRAPNRYLAIDSQSTETPKVGVFDVPDAAPHSYANRGFRIVKTIELQGLDTQESADAAARAEYAKDSAGHSFVSFDATPNPYHDTFDVIALDGVNYLEQSWHLDCTPGGLMSHDGQGTYATGDLS